MSRERCLEVIQRAMADRLARHGIDDLAQHFQGFELYEYLPGLVIIQRENEIHVAADPSIQGKWATRSVLARFFDELLNKWGFLVTRVADDNPAGHSFVQRLGFEAVQDLGGMVVYRMERACIN